MKIRTYHSAITVALIMIFPIISSADKALVVSYPSGCDYFIADGNRGLYLLEWYGGYDPSEDDLIVGDIGSYGMKNVYYPKKDREGRVWDEDFLLSNDSAIEQYRDHCN